jgi:hypothetical protein
MNKNDSDTSSNESDSTNSMNTDDNDSSNKYTDKYKGNDYRYKTEDKNVYCGSGSIKIDEHEKYINIDTGEINNEFSNVEISMSYKGELYNLYVDIERAKYGEDINVIILKNGIKTNLCINTKNRQELINYNFIDCILCNINDKIVIKVFGKQSKARKIKWILSYRKI